MWTQYIASIFIESDVSHCKKENTNQPEACKQAGPGLVLPCHRRPTLLPTSVCRLNSLVEHLMVARWLFQLQASYSGQDLARRNGPDMHLSEITFQTISPTYLINLDWVNAYDMRGGMQRDGRRDKLLAGSFSKESNCRRKMTTEWLLDRPTLVFVTQLKVHHQVWYVHVGMKLLGKLSYRSQSLILLVLCHICLLEFMNKAT